MGGSKDNETRGDDDVNLPQDILINEILLKLPVKSLMKLRCVSKYFKNLLTSPTFVYQHLHHSTSQLDNHLVLISSKSIKTDSTHNFYCKFNIDDHDPTRPYIVDIHCPSFEYIFWGEDGNRIQVPRYSYIQASCNGVLYISVEGNDPDTRYIWNPCTKEYKEIPSPSLTQKSDHLPFGHEYIMISENKFCGFGYDRINDEYKIMYYDSHINNRVHYEEFDGSTFLTEFKLYTLGTNTWRSIYNDDDNIYSSLGFGRWNDTGLFVNGALHWIMSSEESSLWWNHDVEAKVISFDIEKEEFREMQTPQSILEEDEHYYSNLQVLGGCLCMCQVLQSSCCIDIWMLKDYSMEDSWTKLFKIADSVLYSSMDFKLLRYCENDKIVMTSDENTLVVYDPINCKTRCVENIVNQYSAYQMIYIESLVSLNTDTYRG